MREMLLYTAEMKLELSVDMAEKRARVDTLLKQLALEACQNVRIGNSMARGISGPVLSPADGLQAVSACDEPFGNWI